MIKAASNPQEMVNQLIQNNPNFKKAQELGQRYNGDYEKAFRATAKEMGINPEDFLNNMK